jgi:small conductance mechanosensitive channel
MIEAAYRWAAWVHTADSPSPAPSDIIDESKFAGDPTDPAWWERLVEGPILRTLAIIVGAFVVRVILKKVVSGIVKGMTAVAESDMPGTRPSPVAREVIGEDHLRAQRKVGRAATLGRLLTNVGSAVILTVAFLMILGEWGFNVGPLLASAGIVGVALGFGAQSLVSDFLSGVFMLLEDQYGVGDIIDVDGTKGAVEDVHLRVTRLRSVDGTVWWVRNGEVKRVGNMSQNWSVALLDIGVAYDSDIVKVRGIMADEGQRLRSDPELGPLLLEDPEVWGVEDLGDNALVIRMVIKTLPGQQWVVARQLRERLKNRFDAEDVHIPFPQRVVWIRENRPTAKPMETTTPSPSEGQ